jgi:hypothetical protein
MTNARARDKRAVDESYLIGTRHNTPFDRARRDLGVDRAERARAHPIEFDESGFPVPQHDSAVIARVRRLLRI